MSIVPAERPGVALNQRDWSLQFVRDHRNESGFEFFGLPEIGNIAHIANDIVQAACFAQ